jgi:hypothetical protein
MKRQSRVKASPLSVFRHLLSESPLPPNIAKARRSKIYTRGKKMTKVWRDEEDDAIELPPFLNASSSDKLPEWAEQASDAISGLDAPSAGRRKRVRNDELDSALATTAPVLVSRHQRGRAVVPKAISRLTVPRDTAKSVVWHPNGQVAVVGGIKAVYVFHASGSFVENLLKIPVPRRVDGLALLPNGDEAIVVPNEAYRPNLVNILQGTTTELSFLDTRSGLAPYTNTRRDITKADRYVTKVAVMPESSSAKVVAVASGTRVQLASVSSGAVTDTIRLGDAVNDVTFSGQSELIVASKDLMIFYDVRKTSMMLRQVSDEGSTGTVVVQAYKSWIAAGSQTGAVNIYDKAALFATDVKKPAVPIIAIPSKTLLNLTTAISSLSFGEGLHGTFLGMSSVHQKSGCRLVQLPQCAVVPSFPGVSARHEFIQSLSFAPTAPIVSLAEQSVVTNYSL